MSGLQITAAFIIIALGVGAAALFSWGISGLFAGGSRKMQGGLGQAEDHAAQLTRKNLAAKRAHNGE
ncbi:hypothetical protein [Thalassobaculum sp.]|uniref:hypothetical protein n=1 Tax=Thalassobaculum sp. TaxID=2022740 RepID=UPI003B5A18E7